MKFGKILGSSLVLAAAFLTTSVSAHAEHPAYVHALEDLRLMRAFLQQHPTPDPQSNHDAAQAVNEIDTAIRLIKEAAIDDHKDINNHIPIDANIQPVDRFHKAREAGNAAWHDVDQDEDNGFANGLRRRALDHIEAANHLVDNIIHRFDRR